MVDIVTIEFSGPVNFLEVVVKGIVISLVVVV